MYHLAVGSVLADLLLSRTEPLVVDYHNITPARFFDEWDPPILHAVEWGRNQMAALAPRCRLGLADSEFNRAEIAANGYRPTAVAPILLDLEGFDREVDERALAELEQAKQNGGADWLFVGPGHAEQVPARRRQGVRGLPHAARPERAAAHRGSRCLRPLRRRARAPSCASSGSATASGCTGPVSAGALAAYYRAADVYVCLSEHEGFCVPLLESMHFGVPIVAFGVTAVPETLADAGICLPDKSPALVAEAVRPRAHRSRAAHPAAHGRSSRSPADFTLERSRARFLEAMAPVLS